MSTPAPQAHELIEQRTGLGDGVTEIRKGVRVVRTRDGFDYTALCHVHGWASVDVPALALVPECPLCEAQRAALSGRERYELLVR
jgi:hypothetical protein